MRNLLFVFVSLICLQLQAATVFDAVQARDFATMNQLLKENPALIDSQDTDGNTLLHLALRDTIPEFLESILNLQPRVDILSNIGVLPIHWAAQTQPVPIIERLIALGADIRATDLRQGGTALHWAADGGNLEAIDFLIAQGLDPNQDSNSQWKPLDRAASRGQMAALQLLLERGATFPTPNDPDDYFFLVAINSGNIELVSYLIDKGFDPNVRTRGGDLAINQPLWYNQPSMLAFLLNKGATMNGVFDRYNFSPLHVAAFRGSMEMAQTLLDSGAEIDAVKPNDGTTPLQIAIEFKKNELAKFLISKGADIEHPDQYGNTPFNSAVIWENNEMARFLLDKNVDYTGVACTVTPTCPNPTNPPLLNAATRNPEMLQVLLDLGVDINSTNHDGDTALIASVGGDSLTSMRLLISRRADLDRQNKRGVTALLQACQIQNTEKAELLLTAGCDIARCDITGKNALHIAAINGDVPMVNLLLSSNITKDVKDSEQLTALDYAMRYAQSDVIGILQKAGANGRFEQVSEAQNPISFYGDNPQAGCWYLGHSGIAIRSGKNLLIFDYWKQQPHAANPSLYNGWICPDEIRDLNVYVFVSHSDTDHYDRRIFDWQSSIPKLTYVFGFQPEATAVYRQHNYPLPDYVYVPKDSSVTLDGMNIKTLSSPIDDGAGFYVEVNGIKLFHSGDAVNQSKPLPSDYSRSVDQLAAQVPDLDLAFFPVIGCGMNDMEALNLGTDYFIRKLNPKLIIPIHAGGSAYKYDEWADALKAGGINNNVAILRNPGDHIPVAAR